MRLAVTTKNRIKCFGILIFVLCYLMTTEYCYGCIFLIRSHGHFAPMYKVVKTGDRETIKRYLKDHPEELNQKDLYYCDTPLHWAVMRGDPKIVILLISKGAKINEGDRDGKTPLHVAAAKGKNEIVRLLIRREAKAARLDKRGNSPLHNAAANCDLAVIKLLIDKGADINHKNIDGETPFFIAVSSNRLKAIKILGEMGAKINVKNLDGDTPIKVAGGPNQDEITEYLILKGANFQYKHIFDSFEKKNYPLLAFMAFHSQSFFTKITLPSFIILLITSLILIRKRRAFQNP